MITLSNGVAIQALGPDMSSMGRNGRDTRLDALLFDDVEDPEEVRSDVERKWDWLLKTLLPSLDHPLRARIRELEIRCGTGSLPQQLERAGWPVFKIRDRISEPEGRSGRPSSRSRSSMSFSQTIPNQLAYLIAGVYVPGDER
jgi:hypothetical protein